MALTIDQIREDNIVEYEGERVKLVGFNTLSDYRKYLDGNVDIYMIGECMFPKTGHVGTFIQVDFNGNEFKGTNLWCIHNIKNAKFISEAITSTPTPKSSLPEQQFITGMSFKLKSSGIKSGLPVHMWGTNVKILKYKNYINSDLGYGLDLQDGWAAYESDFEAFEPINSSVEVTPKYNDSKPRHYEPGIYGKLPTTIEPYYAAENVGKSSVVMDDPKISVDITPYLNTKVPILNTNN